MARRMDAGNWAAKMIGVKCKPILNFTALIDIVNQEIGFGYAFEAVLFLQWCAFIQKCANISGCV